MIIHDVKQGSQEWLQLRAGMATASEFSRIITPATMKPSKSMKGYAHRLIAEQHLGVPISDDDEGSGFMARGTALEDEAVSFYEFQRDCDVQRVGFVTTERDGYTIGCSPDGLIGDKGGCEIKTPAAHTHIGYLLGDMGEKYRCQIQGSLLICERDWWDFESFAPGMPSIISRVFRDETFIAALCVALDEFHDYMDEARLKLHKEHAMFPELTDWVRENAAA